MHQRIIILQGPHCLGKTFFTNKIKELFDKHQVVHPTIISPDYFMTKNGIFDSSIPSERHAWLSSFKMLEKASIYIPGNRVIIFDARVTNRAERQRFISNCFQNIRSGAKLELINLENPGIEELQKRNLDRSPDRQVPPAFLASQYSKWLSEQPEKKEGFSRFWNPDEFMSYLSVELIEPVLNARAEKRSVDLLNEIVLSEEDFSDSFKG